MLRAISGAISPATSGGADIGADIRADIDPDTGPGSILRAMLGSILSSHWPVRDANIDLNIDQGVDVGRNIDLNIDLNIGLNIGLNIDRNIDLMSILRSISVSISTPISTPISTQYRHEVDISVDISPDPFASWVTSVTSDTLYHDLWRVSEVTHELVVKDRGLPRAIVWYRGAAQSPLRVAHLPGCRTKIALSLHLGPLSLLSLLCDCASPTEFPGLGCSPGRRDSCPPDRSMEDFLAPPGTFFREFIIMLALICSSKATTGATSPQLRHVQSHVQSLETLF